MKNITLSIEDELYHAARVAAAKRNTSISGLVRAALTCIVASTEDGEAEKEADRLQRQALVAALKKSKLELGYRPSREKTYER